MKTVLCQPGDRVLFRSVNRGWTSGTVRKILMSSPSSNLARPQVIVDDGDPQNPDFRTNGATLGCHVTSRDLRPWREGLEATLKELHELQKEKFDLDCRRGVLVAQIQELEATLKGPP